MAASSNEFRSWRNGAMIVWLAFTLTFIGLVVRSVFQDLYPPPAQISGRMTLAGCTDEIESLNRELLVHNAPATARNPRERSKFEADWDAFTRRFEDRIRRVRSGCIDEPPESADESARNALASAVDGLDSLRQHLARCGLEGESEQDAVTAAIRSLHEAGLGSRRTQ